jgi:hypothetical protein
MTRTQQISFGFLVQAVVLFMLYMAATLLVAVKFIRNDPLAVSLPYQHVAAFSNMLLNLSVVSGLLGGGIYVVAAQNADNRIPGQRLKNENLLSYAFSLWTLILILAFFAGVLGLLEGRNLLELPPILDTAQIVVILLIIVSVARSQSRWTPIALVWTVGMALSVVCTLTGLVPTSDYLVDRVLQVLAVGINLDVAYVLAAVALGYWLMHRFSDVPQGWADNSLYTVAGLLSIAGVLVSLPEFYILGAPEWVRILGNIALLVVPILYLIVAAHSYKALSNRNPTVTLAAHWYALGLLLLLIGAGLLGGLQAAPGIRQWTAGTRLSDLQTTLTTFAIVAIVLGVVNQVAAEMRGQNRRVTGLTPFWLVAFGIVGGAAVLGCAGVVQTYLERIAGIGYLETQTLLIPLYMLWLLAWLAIALGIGIYTLTLWLRRPVTTLT